MSKKTIDVLKGSATRESTEALSLTVRVSGSFLRHVWKPLSEENQDKSTTDLLKEAVSLRLLSDRTDLVFKNEDGNYVSAKEFLWGEDK